MAASWAQPWRPAVSHFSRSGTDSDSFHVAALMLALLRLPLLGLALLPILCHLYRGRPCDIRRGSPCYEVGAERSQLVLRWSVFEGASLDPAGDRAEMKRGTFQNQFSHCPFFTLPVWKGARRDCDLCHSVSSRRQHKAAKPVPLTRLRGAHGHPGLARRRRKAVTS